MSTKMFFFSVVILFATASAIAQPPDILWSRRYGGDGEDVCQSVQQTSDGGYIMAGWTSSFGSGNRLYWLLKTDANGDSLWSKTFGDAPYDDLCYSVRETSDGGYILCGSKYYGSNGETDTWLVKTDSNGNLLWNRCYGGSYHDIGYAVRQVSDGGYVFSGITYSYPFGDLGDFYLVKTDHLGVPLWQHDYGEPDREGCMDVQQTSDGGYILAGYSRSCWNGQWNMIWLVKVSDSGDSLWSRCYHAPYGLDGKAYSVQQTSDGGYIVAGEFWADGIGQWTSMLLKTDDLGNEIWKRAYGGTHDESGQSVSQLPDGGYLLAGWTRSFGLLESDAYLVRTDESGNELWSKTFNGENDDFCYDAQPTTDGGFVFAGCTGYIGSGTGDFWLTKTGPEQCSPVTFITWDWGMFIWNNLQTCVHLCNDYGGIHKINIGPFPEKCQTVDYSNGLNIYHGCDFGPDGCNEPECPPATGWSYDPDYWTWIEYETEWYVQMEILLTGEEGCVCVSLSDPLNYIQPDCWLPVELSSFTATPGDRKVTLNWTTASEIDNDYFEILRGGHPVHREASFNSSTGNSYSWTETGLTNGVAYEYTLVSFDFDGSSEELASVSATPIGNAAAITEYALHQNYPNPFNPETSISFDLADAGDVTLTVYNPLGQEIAILADGRMTAGRHTVNFNAAGLPSGMFFYRLETEEFFAMKKMVLMK